MLSRIAKVKGRPLQPKAVISPLTNKIPNGKLNHKHIEKKKMVSLFNRIEFPLKEYNFFEDVIIDEEVVTSVIRSKFVVRTVDSEIDTCKEMMRYNF